MTKKSKSLKKAGLVSAVSMQNDKEYTGKPEIVEVLIKQKDEEAQKLRNKISELDKAHEEELDFYKQKLENVSSDLQKLQKSFQNQMAENNNLKQRIEKLQKKLNEFENLFQNQQEFLDETLKECKDNLKKNEQENNTFSKKEFEEKEKMSSEINELKHKNSQLQEYVKTLEIESQKESNSKQQTLPKPGSQHFKKAKNIYEALIKKRHFKMEFKGIEVFDSSTYKVDVIFSENDIKIGNKSYPYQKIRIII